MRTTTRRVLNGVGLATPFGFLVGVVGGARFTPGPDKVLIAHDYRLRFPAAGAFTIGDVVITRRPYDWLAERPALLQHEIRHAYQWACWVGVPFLPSYLVCAAYSVLRTGSPALHNAFEVRAGLVDGGYVKAV